MMIVGRNNNLSIVSACLIFRILPQYFEKKKRKIGGILNPFTLFWVSLVSIAKVDWLSFGDRTNGMF